MKLEVLFDRELMGKDFLAALERKESQDRVPLVYSQKFRGKDLSGHRRRRSRRSPQSYPDPYLKSCRKTSPCDTYLS